MLTATKRVFILITSVMTAAAFVVGGSVLARTKAETAVSDTTVIFPNNLPAMVTNKQETYLWSTVPAGVEDGNITVDVNGEISNPAPFAVGSQHHPDTSGIGRNWTATASGTLLGNTTWNENILITGDIIVPAGITLTVAPGVTVLFAANSDDQANGVWTDKTEIQVYGALVAEGTEANPIYFTSDSEGPAVGDWGGIVIRKDSTSSSFVNCLIQYANYGVYFYNLKEGGGILSAVISHSTFQKNTTGVRSLERPGTGGGILNTTPIIQHSRFQDNLAYGVDLRLSTGEAVANNYAVLENNVFSANDIGMAIIANSWGGTVRAFTQVRNNTFHNNATNNLYIKGKKSSGSTLVEVIVEHNSFVNATGTNVYVELEQGAVVSPTIRYNTVSQADYGIYLADVNPSGTLAPNIHHNIFFGSSTYAIFNDTLYPVSAEQNYWGQTASEWAVGGAGVVSGTITTTNYLSLNSPPILTYISPGLATTGDTVLLLGANFLPKSTIYLPIIIK